MPNHYTTIAVGSARYDEEKGGFVFNEDEFNNRKGNWNFCEQVRPMPEEVKGEVPGPCPPWLQWASEYWGTKWGTYREKAHRLGGDGNPVAIEFQSAWGPPNTECLQDIAHWMDETLGIEGVKFVGHQPYDNTTEVLDIKSIVS